MGADVAVIADGNGGLNDRIGADADTLTEARPRIDYRGGVYATTVHAAHDGRNHGKRPAYRLSS